MSETTGMRRNLLDLMTAALRRVEGRHAVQRFLARQPQVPCAVLAVGKAAESMCEGALEVLGERLHSGLLITKTGHVDRARWANSPVAVVEAAHPVPDARSLRAGEQMLGFIARLPAGLPLLVLISGGASALVEVLVPEVSLDDLQRANAWMLGNGLAIDQINRVRRCLSRIKSGGLLNYLKDRPVQGLVISDVPDDDPAVIGSGLLVPAALGDLVALPEWLHERVTPAMADPPQPPPGPPIHLVATLQDAIEAVANRARALGLSIKVHAERLGGDTHGSAVTIANALRAAPKGVQVWGGETTLVLPPKPGRGGRNQHFALCLAQQLAGSPRWACLAVGTDGTDGPTEDAGGLVDGGTWQRALDGGVDPAKAIVGADSGSALAAAGDLVNTGPTGTNVMDLVIASTW